MSIVVTVRCRWYDNSDFLNGICTLEREYTITLPENASALMLVAELNKLGYEKGHVVTHLLYVTGSEGPPRPAPNLALQMNSRVVLVPTFDLVKGYFGVKLIRRHAFPMETYTVMVKWGPEDTQHRSTLVYWNPVYETTTALFRRANRFATEAHGGNSMLSLCAASATTGDRTQSLNLDESLHGQNTFPQQIFFNITFG